MTSPAISVLKSAAKSLRRNFVQDHFAFTQVDFPGAQTAKRITLVGDFHRNRWLVETRTSVVITPVVDILFSQEWRTSSARSKLAAVGKTLVGRVVEVKRSRSGLHAFMVPPGPKGLRGDEFMWKTTDEALRLVEEIEANANSLPSRIAAKVLQTAHRFHQGAASVSQP